MAEKQKKIALSPAQLKLLTDVVYSETGHADPAEHAAVASAYMNRIREVGFERAIAGSSAYKYKSPQFVKASSNQLTPYERKIWTGYAATSQNFSNNPETILPYTHHENIKAFGVPGWAKGQTDYKDIGTQRFYVIHNNPRVKVLK